MNEIAAAKTFIYLRIATAVASKWSLYPQFADEFRPVYWGEAEPNAPGLHVVFAMLNAGDILTQAKSLEYVDIDISMVVNSDARGDHTQFIDNTSDHEGLASVMNSVLTEPSTPYDVTLSDPWAGTYEVTCDRISSRSFVTRENGGRQSIVEARYLVRVQRKIG
jgi:hypothetical protein